MTDFATAAGAPDPATADRLNETAEAIKVAVAALSSARRVAEAWAARNEDAAEITSALAHVEQLPILDLDHLAEQLADLGQAVLSGAEQQVRAMPGMGDSDSWSLGWRSGRSDAAGELRRYAAQLRVNTADAEEPAEPGPRLRGAADERRTPPAGHQMLGRNPQRPGR